MRNFVTGKMLWLITGFSILSGVPIADASSTDDDNRTNGAATAPDAGEIISVGTATAHRGELRRGVIVVPQGIDAGYEIPVIVINGARPGPTLALIAGLHGSEFAGIVTLQRLATRLIPATLSGAVVIVPLVNIAAFEQVVRRVNPVDGKNMNRFFPGTAAGTQTERASHAITSEVLATADYVIDYHGGDLDEDQHPYAYWIQTGMEQIDSAHERMLRAFGINYIIKFAATDLNPNTANLLPTQAVSLGIPTITVDAGRAGTYTTEDLRLLTDGTLNVMGHLGMLKRRMGSLRKPVYFERTIHVNSAKPGTFYPLVGRGQRVTKGDRIGYVTDRFGDVVFDAVAPESAIVLYLNSTPSVIAGGQLFYLGVPAEGR